jgi:DNA invertase Pin-like site-specific DNA recombinase
MIGDRTKAALQIARSRGTQLGRPSGVDEQTRRLIRILRESGKSYQGIADALTSEGIPTAQGGQWRASTVRKLYGREVA